MPFPIHIFSTREIISKFICGIAWKSFPCFEMKWKTRKSLKYLFGSIKVMNWVWMDLKFFFLYSRTRSILFIIFQRSWEMKFLKIKWEEMKIKETNLLPLLCVLFIIIICTFYLLHIMKIREEFSMEKLTDISIINISFYRPSKTTSSSTQQQYHPWAHTRM